jgi:hypothetical protein
MAMDFFVCLEAPFGGMVSLQRVLRELCSRWRGLIEQVLGPLASAWIQVVSLGIYE